MNYKFVDIGTCYFATSIDDFGTDVDGILVEPIKKFLDVIPASPRIKKECAAVSTFDGPSHIMTLFSQEDLDNANLTYYTHAEREQLRNDGLWWHISNRLIPGAALGSLNKDVANDTIVFNGIENDHVRPTLKHRIDIQCITFDTLIKKYNIHNIEYLRIDVEGLEVVVLSQVFMALKNNAITIDNIQFEYQDKNYFKINNKLDNLIKAFISEFNYTPSRSSKDDDFILSKQ